MEHQVKLHKDDYYVSCPKGLEDLLANELVEIGLKCQLGRTPGGVEFSGEIKDAFRVLLQSRIASRIYKKFYSLRFFNEKDLYNQSKSVPWRKVFNLDQSFKIKTIMHRHTNFKSSMYLSQMLKDGICDRFRSECNDKRPDVDKTSAALSFLLYIAPTKDPKLTSGSIYIDMSGTPLSHRGYRTEGFSAPLRENLAAALVISSKLKREELLIDSMMGSGTWLIEAALYKSNIPPSFLRIRRMDWDFLQHLYYKNNPQFSRVLESEIDRVKEKRDKGMKFLQENPKDILGFDISAASIRVAKQHIKNCDLQDVITIRRHDAQTLINPTDRTGMIICNIPYGERLGEIEDLESLYHNYGENLKNNFQGFNAYIFTGNPELRKKISLKTKQRIPFYNGKLDCRLIQYELF